MMINAQIWNMKMGSLCSKISDLCNWQCLFPCQTNQTTLRLSTHVANDWWGFYCDYVVLSLAHYFEHSPSSQIELMTLKNACEECCGAFESDAHFNRQSSNDKRFVMRFSWEFFSSYFDFIVSHIIFGVHCDFNVIRISLNDEITHINRQTHTNWCIRLQMNKNIRIDIINSVMFIRKLHCFCAINWIITIHKVGDVKLNGAAPKEQKQKRY